MELLILLSILLSIYLIEILFYMHTCVTKLRIGLELFCRSYCAILCICCGVVMCNII